MYPASSRHRDRRRRSARTPARRRPDLRPLLEALETRQLLSGVVSNIDNAPIVQLVGDPSYMYNESYNNSGNTPPKAIDGDVNTSWDNAAPGSVIGYSYYDGRVARLTSASVYPSPASAASMVGGRFEASDDGAYWTVLGSITSAPAQGQFTSIPLYDPTHFYKKFRYVAPSAGYGTVAEIKFFGNVASALPLAPTNFTYTAGPDSLTVLWDDNAINATSYNVSLSTAPYGGTTVGGQTLGGDATSATFTNLTPGTYYFHIGGYTQGATIGPIYTTNMPLVGTPIGTAGSWGNSGNTFDKAFDGDTNTYFDAPTSPAYVGYDFGTPTTVASVSYVPRVGQESRMVGGQIRGSNDGVNWTTLATITTTPWSNGTNKLTIANPAAFRYIQYLSPQDGYGNVAELHFYGPRPAVTETVPTAPPGATSINNGSSILISWPDNATNEFAYVVELYDNPAHTGAPVAYQTLLSNVTSATFQVGARGTYYATVRAVNNAGSSSAVSAPPVTYNGEPAYPITLSYTAGTNSLTFNWHANSGDETGYVAELSLARDFSTLVGSQTLPAYTRTATFTGLAPDTYFFRVRATNAAGSSQYTYLTAIVSGPSVQLVGRPIGTPGSWNNEGNDLTKALDGDTTTFFDAPTSQAYVGYDFGGPITLSSISFYPRRGQESRMVGGMFQASADGVNWQNIAWITAAPSGYAYTTLEAHTYPGAFQYVRYLSPDGGYGNVAELQFYGSRVTTTASPTPPTNVAGTSDRTAGSVRVTWGDAATSETGYEAEISTTRDFSAGFRTQTVAANATEAVFTSVTSGTYYVRVRALGSSQNSAWSVAVSPVTLSSPAPVAPSDVTGELAVVNGIVNLYYKWTVAGSNAPDVGYQISTAPDFATIFSDGTLSTATGLLYQNPPSGTYYFRVRTISAAGASAFVAAPGPLTVPAGVPQDPTRLLGRDIGTGSAYDTPTSYGRALDGNVSTYFDSPTSQAYVGYDLGSLATLTSVRVYPRQGFASRMVGGAIQGSNDNVNWTTLATISSAPAENQYTTLPINDARTFAYVRYLSPVGGYGDIAELQFYGRSTTAPLAPADVAGTADGTTSIRVSWTDVSRGSEAGFEAQVSTTPDFSAGVVTRTTSTGAAQALFTPLGDGTYYIRVRALGGTRPNSAWVTAASPVTLAPPVTGNQLTGTPIGTPGSWSNSGNDLTKAFDGDTTTFFDAPIGDAWVGLDLGTAHPLDHVRFFPRAGLAWRMVDGTFQGSNDGVNWTTLATISSEPAEGTYTSMSLGGGSFRYVRYQGAAWGSGNVAELQFYTTGEPVPTGPAAPNSATGFTTPSNHLLSYTWRDNATNETGYQTQLSTTPDFSTILRTDALAPNSRQIDMSNISDGTYYFRVRSLGSNGPASSSAWAYAAPINVDNVAVQLTGTPIGTPGSWNNSGNDITKVFDNSPGTFFDAPTSQAYVGLDFGHQVTVTQVDYYARVGQEARMVGGQFRVSNDGVNWTTIHTVTEVPLPNVPYTFAVPNPGAYRYLSYLSPQGGFGNIAEMRAYGVASPVSTRVPGTRIGTAGSWNNSGNTLDKAFDNDLSTFFDAPTSPAFAGLDFGKPVVVTSVIYAPRAGYESRMVGGQIRASDDGVNWVTLATINSAPKAGEYSVINIASPSAHRYVEYLSPDGGFGNVAELQFLGYVA